MNELVIRASTPADQAALNALYCAAFPDEELWPLVTALLEKPEGVLSLTGVLDSKVVGHVVFTLCGLEGSAVRTALLAPLAVDPACQRSGIGSALVGEGLLRSSEAKVSAVYVLGDPAYYSRFGFASERAVEPPYALPPDWESAWQSKRLGESSEALVGRLSVPMPWRDRRWWLP